MPSRRRRRRTQEQTTNGRDGRSISSWKWLTFPVYCALVLGLFAGYSVGFDFKSHARFEEYAGLIFAALLSLGLAQLVTRPFAEMMYRRRAQQQRAKAGQEAGKPSA